MISTHSSHRLVDFAALSPETERLWRALPRDVRITRGRLFELAGRLGLTTKGAMLRVGMLVRHGFLEELPARDGSASMDRWEWRVRE